MAGTQRSNDRGGGGRTVSLPVLTDSSGGRKVPDARRVRSRMARWRMGVLIAVHAAMVSHVLHWWMTGRSAGRFVLSDSMQTLELGEINPGFVLFVLALGATAVFGRLMCGWVCHMGAMQDACAWALRKIGVRPRMFRSRLLGYVPLGMAVYMFLWPSVRRAWAALTSGGSAVPEYSVQFVTEDLWNGLPSVWVAVPFLLVCGAATVYFLGARGLCRYGCPYGGFLLPAEQVAPMRVVVDMTKCDQCGLCTAACTAGVRVHDEVREFGSVVDRNCVRSLDCVSVCPQGALKFGFARPAAISGRGREKRYDLSWGEEIACAGVFVASFLALRGAYEAVPMLMAGTLAVLTAFFAWVGMRMMTSMNVRLGGVQMKLHGRVRRGGWAVVGLMLIGAGLIVQAGFVELMLLEAEGWDRKVDVGFDGAMRGGASAEAKDHAERALRWHDRSRALWNGGWGLASTPTSELRRAWMLIVLGRHDDAERGLHAAIDEGRVAPTAGVELARLLCARGRAGEAEEILRDMVDAWPRHARAREFYVMLLLQRGQVQDAEQVYARVLERWTGDGTARAGRGRLCMMLGHAEEGLGELSRAAADWPANPDIRREYAVALASVGRLSEAIAELESAAEARPGAKVGLLNLAAQMRAYQSRSQ